MQRKFVTYLFFFFTPLVVLYGVIEFITLNLPSNYAPTAEYMDAEAARIEVLIFGSSQMKGGINPEFISQPALNLASGNQHHDTDFRLLKALIDRFPQLKTVVLETSYSHFELPHNGKRFWKNNVFLHYYGANNFERPTYFKDQLIYLSNPDFFTEKIVEHYSSDARKYSFNRFGYDTLNYYGLFKNLEYNEKRISEKKVFKINKVPNLEIFEANTTLFTEMLQFLKERNIQVVLCQPPMYKTYLPQRVPEILARRDSVVAAALTRFDNVTLLPLEEDTTQFGVHDYWNQSHLNPKGGKKFTEILDAHLKSLN